MNEQGTLSPARALPLVPIVMCASAVDRLVGVRIVDDWSWGIGIAAAVAGLIGVPCAIWLLERQETRSASFATWGAAAGAVPLLATLVSGMIGRYARGGMAWLTEFMAHSAPIPLIGATPWPVFLQWELRNILIGDQRPDVLGGVCADVPCKP